MGFLQDILEKDTDGQLKRHLFRTITVGSYAFLLVTMMFIGGVVWRVFDGSEVEIFGLKVSGNAEKGGNSTKNKKPRESDKYQATPGRSETSPPAPAAVPVALGLAAAPQNLAINTAWQVLPHGDFQACLQEAKEVAGLARLSDISSNNNMVWGVLRHDTKPFTNVSMRCMDVNGISTAFLIAYGASEVANSSMMETLIQEFSIKAKGATTAMFGGAGKNISIFNGYVVLKLPDVEQCKTTTNEALLSMKASNLSSSASGASRFLFAVVETSRLSVICAPFNNVMTAVYNVAGFNDSEVRRLRDQLSARYEPFKQ